MTVPLPFERERFAERMLAALGPRTKLLFVSHVTSTTALVFPLAGLCAGARCARRAHAGRRAHAPGPHRPGPEGAGRGLLHRQLPQSGCARPGRRLPARAAGHQALIEAPVIQLGLRGRGRRPHRLRRLHRPHGARAAAAVGRARATSRPGSRCRRRSTSTPPPVARGALLLPRAGLRRAAPRVRTLRPAASQPRRRLRPDGGARCRTATPRGLRARLYRESRIRCRHAARRLAAPSYACRCRGYNTPGDVERLLTSPALAA